MSSGRFLVMWTKHLPDIMPDMSGACLGMSRYQTRGTGDSSVGPPLTWPGHPRGLSLCGNILWLIRSRGAGTGQKRPVPSRPQGDVGLVMESDSQPQDHDSSVSAMSLSSSLSQPISESLIRTVPRSLTGHFLLNPFCALQIATLKFVTNLATTDISWL